MLRTVPGGAPGSRCAVWLQRHFKCPRQESNLVLDLRRVACESTTLRGHLYNCHPSSALSRNRTRAPTDRLVVQLRRLPCLSATLTDHSLRADDWIRTSIKRCVIGTLTRPPPFSVEPRRHLPSKHEREESNPVRQLWRLAALPGAHSSSRRGPGPVKARSRTHQSSSSTFQ